MWVLDVDWSAYALKRSSEHASGRVASRLFLVQDGQPRQYDETLARSVNLVNSLLDLAAGNKLGVWRRVQAGRLVTALVKALGVLLGGWSGEVVLPGRLEKGSGQDVLQVWRLEKA